VVEAPRLDCNPFFAVKRGASRCSKTNVWAIGTLIQKVPGILGGVSDLASGRCQASFGGAARLVGMSAVKFAGLGEVHRDASGELDARVAITKGYPRATWLVYRLDIAEDPLDSRSEHA
jgi:hypothetical protein